MSTNFRDSSGDVRLIGTIYAPGATVGDVFTVQADGSLAPAPGGGSQPVQAVYSGSNVTIADGASAPLTWDTLDIGTELLDRSSPGIPLWLADGVYAITITYVASAPLTAGGYASAQLSTGNSSTAAQSSHPDLFTGVCLVAQVVAGDFLALFVQNFDGATARDFQLFGCTIVKLA